MLGNREAPTAASIFLTSAALALFVGATEAVLKDAAPVVLGLADVAFRVVIRIILSSATIAQEALKI